MMDDHIFTEISPVECDHHDVELTRRVVCFFCPTVGARTNASRTGRTRCAASRPSQQATQGGDDVASFASRDLYETNSSGSRLRVGFPGRGLGSSGGGPKRLLTLSLS